jgi:ubiquinone/menaquinone biosynthesis C-methylase UbiE
VGSPSKLETGTPGAVLGDAQLLDTQKAFDSVAADYDGPRGNNELIQRMRVTLWETVCREIPVGRRLLDLGCGTGIDAVEFARSGYDVVASDWSPQMVERTRLRAEASGFARRVQAMHVGVHQLDRIVERFDGIYSNFGPLNCAPDMRAVAEQCQRLLRPGGTLIFSVIGRICPWEMAYYTFKGRFRRATVRMTRGATAVGMNRHTIWTRYYLPREFYRAFADGFTLESYRALSLFMPPPYLVETYRRHRDACERLGRLDDKFGALPGLRDMGDHFLIVMRRR